MHPTSDIMKMQTNKNQTGKVHITMINQKNPSEQTKIAFLKAFKALKLAGLLRDSGIRKAQGIKVAHVFELLLLLGFQGKIYTAIWIQNIRKQRHPKILTIVF